MLEQIRDQRPLCVGQRLWIASHIAVIAMVFCVSGSVLLESLGIAWESL